MNKIAILTLVVYLICLAYSDQNVPISKKPFGVVIGDIEGSFNVQCFFDLLCNESKATYLTLKQVFRSIDLVRMRVKFTYNIHPLAWHFYAAKVNTMVFYLLNKFGVNSAEKYIDLMFTNLDNFDENKWLDRTANEYLDNLANFVATQFHLDFDQIRKQLEQFSNTRNIMIQNWKYSVSVLNGGVPTCYANGARIDNAQKFGFAEWINFFKSYTI